MTNSLIENQKELLNKIIAIHNKNTKVVNQKISHISVNNKEFSLLKNFIFHYTNLNYNLVETYSNYLNEYLINKSEFSDSFYKTLYQNDFLCLDTIEAKSYEKFFFKNITNVSDIYSEFLENFLELHKPFFISKIDTHTLNLVHRKSIKTFKLLFKENLVKQLKEHHFIENRNGLLYLYTNKRFNLSFTDVQKVIDKSIDDTLATFSDQHKLIATHILCGLHKEENLIFTAYAFFFNATDTSHTYDCLIQLAKFDMAKAKNTHLEFFTNDTLCSLENYQLIQQKTDALFDNYGATFIFNPYLSSNNSNTVFNPETTLTLLNTSLQHWSELNKFYNITDKKYLNKNLIVNTPLVTGDDSALASFNSNASHSYITYNSHIQNKDNAYILIHEYLHYLDNKFLDSLNYNFSNGSRTHMEHLSSFANIDFQHIFTKNSHLQFEKTPKDIFATDKFLNSSYQGFFNTYLYSLISANYIDEKIILNNHLTLERLHDFSKIFEADFTNMCIHSFKESLYSLTNIQEKQSFSLEKIKDYLSDDNTCYLLTQALTAALQKSIIPSYMATYKMDKFQEQIRAFNEDIIGKIEEIHNLPLYEKVQFLLNFENKSHLLNINYSLLTDISNSLYVIQNTLIELDPSLQDIFIFGKNNINLSATHLNSTNILSNQLFLNALTIFNKKLLSEDFSSLKSSLEKYLLQHNIPVQIISIATDTNFFRTYAPIPNVFNRSTVYCLNSTEDNGTYLLMGSEILARGIASIASMKDKIISPLNFLHQFKYSLDMQKDPTTLSIKDFDKTKYLNVTTNFFSFLDNFNQYLSCNPYYTSSFNNQKNDKISVSLLPFTITQSPKVKKAILS